MFEIADRESLEVENGRRQRRIGLAILKDFDKMFRPASASLALAGSRTATVTMAPAPSSARVVSSPMPDAPPVIRAVFPLRSWPEMTSGAVASRVNPDVSLMRPSLKNPPRR